MRKINFLLLFMLLTGFIFPQEIVVNIPKGATVSDIGQILKDRGAISSLLWFKLNVKRLGVEAGFRYGKYRIDTDASIAEMIRQLQDPRQIALIRITIPEGYNLSQIDTLLSEEGLFEPGEFYRFTTTPKLFSSLIALIPPLKEERNIPRLEGFLFPDTYYVEEGITLKKFVQTMMENFSRKVLPIYKKAQKNKTLPVRLGRTLSFYNIISLAALVELEAAVDRERPIIASVYMNRMNRRMILGACPTVHYARLLNGLPRTPTLTYTDLEIDSDYNTYNHLGLPPSPVSNPGLKSIQAALHPARTNYFFFVSKHDGTHHFSKTEREHNIWKNKLLR